MSTEKKENLQFVFTRDSFYPDMVSESSDSEWARRFEENPACVLYQFGLEALPGTAGSSAGFLHQVADGHSLPHSQLVEEENIVCVVGGQSG